MGRGHIIGPEADQQLCASSVALWQNQLSCFSGGVHMLCQGESKKLGPIMLLLALSANLDIGHRAESTRIFDILSCSHRHRVRTFIPSAKGRNNGQMHCHCSVVLYVQNRASHVHTFNLTQNKANALDRRFAEERTDPADSSFIGELRSCRRIRRLH